MANFNFTEGSGKVGAAQDIGGVLHPKVIPTEIDGSDTALAAKIGSLTEAAPATDTASSGLNGRLQRIAQRITSLIAQIPAALGQTTKTGSMSVTLASDDDLQSKVGSLTETAPASDTASSGLNGRLQRIAQRITTLIGSTLATSVADGSNVTMGAKGDAKSTATDTTAVSAMSVLKQISFSIQAAATSLAGTIATSIADGSHTTFGAKADAKSTATDTTAISAMSVWKQISSSVQAIATSVAGTLTVATHAVTQSGNWTARIVGNIGAVIDGVITAATAPANGIMGLGVFNSTEPSPTTGQSVGIQLDSKGRQRQVIMDAAGNTRGANVDASNRLSVTVDAFTATNASVNVAQINGVTPLMGAGNTGTGSPRVTVATDQAAVATWGHGATAASVPANATYAGRRGTTALPTAVTDGQQVGSMADKFGRTVVLLGTIRDLIGTQTTTISASTSETTIVTAGGAGVFNDLAMLIVSNTSASTNSRIDFRDTTAGSILFSLESIGGAAPVGFSLPGQNVPQTGANTNWTAQCATSTTDIRVYAVFAKNK